MQILREVLDKDILDIPAVLIVPDQSPRGAAVFVHGYGGCKEEQLGLAWRIAEEGLIACAIDLRGHGQNRKLLDENVLDDVEAAVRHFSPYGKVIAVGHSLGGRLALLSQAEYAIGISPALSRNFSLSTQEKVRLSRGYRVRDIDKDAVFGTLRRLPQIGKRSAKNMMLVHGTRDVREIIAISQRMAKDGVEVLQVEEATHADIFLVEETITSIIKKINLWA